MTFLMILLVIIFYMWVLLVCLYVCLAVIMYPYLWITDYLDSRKPPKVKDSTPPFTDYKEPFEWDDYDMH